MFFLNRYHRIKEVLIHSLLEYISQLSESDWLADEAIKTSLAGARPTQSIFLLNLGESELLEILKHRPIEQSDIRQCQGWETLNIPTMSLVQEVLETYPPGGIITRMQLAKLPSGNSISPHFDTGFILRSSHRIHIPLITDEHVDFWLEGQKTFFKAGVAVEINNRIQHSVNNGSSIDRIHLIFDYLPPKLNNYSFLSKKSAFIHKTSLDPHALPSVLISTINPTAKPGENHGSIHRVNFSANRSSKLVDWNQLDTNAQPQDMGLRGISLLGKRIFATASDQLIQFGQSGKFKQSWRNPYLKEAQSLCIIDKFVYLTSPAFDSILRFNLEINQFDQAWMIRIKQQHNLLIQRYDPRKEKGPQAENTLQLNHVYPHSKGLIFSGANYSQLMLLHSKGINALAKIPLGTQHAQPYRGGLLYQQGSPNKIILQIQNRQISFAQGVTGRLYAFKGSQVISALSRDRIAIVDIATQKVLHSMHLPLDKGHTIHSIELLSLN